MVNRVSKSTIKEGKTIVVKEQRVGGRGWGWLSYKVVL